MRRPLLSLPKKVLNPEPLPPLPHATELIKLLVEWRPDLFSNPPVPLAVGIDKAVIQAKVLRSRKAVSRALYYWTKHHEYLAVLRAGSPRHGVDGISGEVTEQDAKAANARFYARKPKGDSQ